MLTVERANPARLLSGVQRVWDASVTFFDQRLNRVVEIAMHSRELAAAIVPMGRRRRLVYSRRSYVLLDLIATLLFIDGGVTDHLTSPADRSWPPL